MMRSVLQFFSMLAIGIISLGIVAAMLPWLSGRLAAPGPGPSLHFESALFGLALGLLFGVLGRYHWTDIPRRLVTWFLVRERQFFYYLLITGCIAVLLFY